MAIIVSQRNLVYTPKGWLRIMTFRIMVREPTLPITDIEESIKEVSEIILTVARESDGTNSTDLQGMDYIDVTW